MDTKINSNLSQMKHRDTEPCLKLTINTLLQKSILKYSDRIAIHSYHQQKKLTYQQVYEKVENFGAGLIALGLEKGDHVGLWSPDTIEGYISYLGILNAGLVAVIINPLYEYSELRNDVKKGDVKALIIGEQLNKCNFYSVIEKIIPDISSYEINTHVDCEDLPFLKTVISTSENYLRGTYRWSDIFTISSSNDWKKLEKIKETMKVDDLCKLLFTSGTTGHPKAICLTHFNIINNSYFVSKRLTLQLQHHKIGLQVPFYHILGSVFGILGSIHCGSTLVVSSLKYSPYRTIDMLIEEKCTVLYGTPTMFTDILRILNEMSSSDPSIYSKVMSLKMILSGGNVLPPELIKNMRKILQIRQAFSIYGMTECGADFMSLADDSDDLIFNTVGCILDHTEVKIIDEHGEVVPFGKPGNCCVRSHANMLCYYKDEEMTKQITLPGGWISTGDRFILYENGYGKICGRIKDTIIRGGENIEPRDIEDILTTHPDIIAIQAFGVTDPRLGEVVAVSIIKNKNSTLDKSTLQKFCEGKIASYKIPKYVEFLDTFPLLPNGKVIKSRLPSDFEKKLLLQNEK